MTKGASKKTDPPYALLVRYVWEGIQRLTGSPPCTLPGVGSFGAFCPVGCGGTVLIEFFDDPARVRFSADTWTGEPRPDQCSTGCTADRILAALA